MLGKRTIFYKLGGLKILNGSLLKLLCKQRMRTVQIKTGSPEAYIFYSEALAAMKDSKKCEFSINRICVLLMSQLLVFSGISIIE